MNSYIQPTEKSIIENHRKSDDFVPTNTSVHVDNVFTQNTWESRDGNIGEFLPTLPELSSYNIDITVPETIDTGLVEHLNHIVTSYKTKYGININLYFQAGSLELIESELKYFSIVELFHHKFLQELVNIINKISPTVQLHLTVSQRNNTIENKSGLNLFSNPIIN